MPNAKPPQTLTVTQAAALLQRSTRWVHMRVQEGWIAKEGRGRYAVVNLVRGTLAYYEDQLTKAQKAVTANRATEARIREIELRIAEREGRLMPVEDCQAVVADLAALVLEQLGGLPARCTRDLTLRDKIDAEVGRTLDKIRAGAARASESVCNVD